MKIINWFLNQRFCTFKWPNSTKAILPAISDPIKNETEKYSKYKNKCTDYQIVL